MGGVADRFGDGSIDNCHHRLVQYKLLEMRRIMEKKTGIAGTIGFLAGVAIGAFGLWATFRNIDEQELEEIDDLAEEEVADHILVAKIPVSAFVSDSLKGLKISGKDADIYRVRVAGAEWAKTVAVWGSKGKEGDQPTEFSLLQELSTEHLTNILEKSQNATHDERRLIEIILEERQGYTEDEIQEAVDSAVGED